MKLIIIRHGIAHDVGEHGIRRDADRMLTDTGKKKVWFMAEGLKDLTLDGSFALISSPLVRARETADIFHEVLRLKEPVLTSDEMAPGGDFAQLFREAAQTGAENVCVFGHMPDVSALAGYGLTGTPLALLKFKKAGMACISFFNGPRAGDGVLEWHVAPGVWRPIVGARR